MLKLVSRTDPIRTTAPAHKVLIVDDELPVLLTLKRALRRRYELEVALNARHALELLQTRGPFAVIVSDMHMPGDDGVTFLEQARMIAPNSQRIMLTGDLERATAVAAVNRSRVFRFIEKPCPADQLAEVIDEAVKVHVDQREAEKAPGNVLAAFQQDLHTPLHHMLNHARLIREGMVSGSAVKDYAQQIVDCGEDLLSVSETVMDMVSLQSSDFDPRTTTIDAGSIVRSAHKQNSRRAAAKGLELSVAVCSDSLPVLADARLLQRAVSSVIGTAIRHGSMDECIDIRLDTAGESHLYTSVTIDWAGHQSVDELMVIADRPLEELLRTGAWLRDATSLDLPLAKVIIERMDGYLEFEAPLPGRLVTRIVLPIRRKQVPID